MGALGISLESTAFQAGSTLAGSVYFDITKDVPGTSVVASFIGEEIAKVQYDDGVGEQRTTRHEIANRPLIALEIPLDYTNMIQNGKIRAGKYQMPFEIMLPSILPSSLEVIGRTTYSQCLIQYDIRAQIKGSGRIQDYKTNQKVTILAAPLQAEGNPYNGPPVLENVTFLCCINRGHIIFGARVADTLLDKGESVQVAISCRNRSSIKITKVTAQLVEVLQWTVRIHSEFKRRVLAELNFGNFPGMERMAATVGHVSKEGDTDDIYRDLERGTYAETIQMPENANDTFAGKLINCRHHITVTVETSSCIANPTIEIPIQAGPPPVKGRPASAVAPPEGFNEQASVFNIVQAPFSDGIIGGPTLEASEDRGDEIGAVSIGKSHMPSADILVKDLHDTVSDYDLVKERVNDASWKPIFASMTPATYGKIIQQVDLDFDQLKVAQTMAPAINSFSCNHCVAGIRGASEWNRASIVDKVLPYVTDLATNKESILTELSEWEKTVTKQSFQRALRV